MTSPIPLREELLAGWDDAEEQVDPGHVCAAWRESATHPDPNGHIVVTEFCDCGRIVSVYDDSIL